MSRENEMQDRPECDTSNDNRNVEDALESEALFHLMVDSVKDYAIFALDTEGRVATWNRGAAHLKGYCAAEIIGKHFSVFYTPEDIANGKPAQELQIAQREGNYKEDAWRVRKDGTHFWASVVITPMWNAEGELRGYAKVTRDLDERQQMQAIRAELEREAEVRTAALKASESQLRLVLDATPASIVYVDREQRYRFSNPVYARGLGLLPDEIAGKRVQEVLGVEHYELLRPYIERALSGQAVTYETERPFPGGIRHVHATYVPDIGPDDVVKGMVAMIYDVTEEKEAQKAQELLLREVERQRALLQQTNTELSAAETTLQQMNDELEARVEERTADLVRSNADLQQFAYVASHDLQEPLRMVASFMQLLEKRYKGRLDEQADRWIEYAVDGATRMQTLINDLLAYSRVGTHGNAFNFFALTEVLSNVVKNLQLSIVESGAEITFDAMPGVTGDAVQLTSLFQNLIENSIKYRGENTPRIHVSAQRQGEDWLFCVRDNGIGFDPQFSERIFIIFQRLHNRTKYPGTGIGLAVCKRIVERHSGRIWVETEPGKGAAFYFTLPVTPKESRYDRTESL
jgi:PAS domain S-box-containing protein